MRPEWNGEHFTEIGFRRILLNKNLYSLIKLHLFLTHWGRVTYTCVSKVTIIGSDIWTNAGILLTGPLRTNFSEILIEIQTFSFKKIHMKMSSGKWGPFCLGLNVLRIQMTMDIIGVEMVIIGVDNGLVPVQHQAFTWTKGNLLL